MTSHSTNDKNVDLVGKLQGFEATLRRERDDAHRENQLAAERLRLVQEEAAALQKTVQALRDKIQVIQNESGETAPKEIVEYKNNVEDLTKQVRRVPCCVVVMEERMKKDAGIRNSPFYLIDSFIHVHTGRLSAHGLGPET
jgi:peptidoglycan hydrolase CwlO-like protein